MIERAYNFEHLYKETIKLLYKNLLQFQALTVINWFQGLLQFQVHVQKFQWQREHEQSDVGEKFKITE